MAAVIPHANLLGSVLQLLPLRGAAIAALPLFDPVDLKPLLGAAVVELHVRPPHALLASEVAAPVEAVKTARLAAPAELDGRAASPARAQEVDVLETVPTLSHSPVERTNSRHRPRSGPQWPCNQAMPLPGRSGSRRVARFVCPLGQHQAALDTPIVFACAAPMAPTRLLPLTRQQSARLVLGEIGGSGPDRNRWRHLNALSARARWSGRPECAARAGYPHRHDVSRSAPHAS